MPDYSTLLANKAKKVTFTDPDTGKVYEVSFLTAGKKGEFEAWVKANARAAIAEMRDLMTPDEWHQEAQNYRAEVAAGKYGFHGPYATGARGTIDGGVSLAAILFGCSVAEMQDLAERQAESIRTLLEEVIIASQARERVGEGQEGNGAAPAKSI